MIEQDTFTFLTQLAQNNDRAWFQDNKARYDQARENVLDFTASLIRGLARFDLTIPADLAPNSCVMRIYRDVRFSKNKAPYKNNFGIAISGNGKNFNGSGYYLQVQPGKSFIGGGSWMPEADQLKKIRQEIDYNGADLLSVLKNESFKKLFGDLSQEDKLKTAPKGYEQDHPMIGYLKLKSFTASTVITDKQLTVATATTDIVDMFETLNPLLVFLRNAIA